MILKWLFNNFEGNLITDEVLSENEFGTNASEG